MGTEPLERKLAAILYADVAGYSRLTGEDEDGTHRALRACLDAITSHIQLRSGRVVHYAGDAVLAEFGTASDALSCAVDVQRDLLVRNQDLPDERKVQFRIGVNLGEVIVDQEEIYGDGVNVAARLESLAERGGICISEAVRTAVGKKLPLNYEFMGEQRVKNIEESVRTYRVRLEVQTASPYTPSLGISVKPSLAVLPFTNMSGDPEQEYFSDGITEDITTALSNVRSFLVAARHSAFAYKGKAIDVRQVGKELGVGYVLEGSVRRAGDRVRVTAQLIETGTGQHVWANRYDGTLSDIFDLQDQITASIVGALEPEFLRAELERSRQKRPENMAAYDYVLHGTSHMWKLTPEDTRLALQYFHKAIEKDPAYGRAYACAFWCYRRQVHLIGLALPKEDQAKAIQLMEAALRIDSDDPLVLWQAGSMKYLFQGDFEGALALINRALSMDPNSPRAWSASAMVHSYMGDTATAIEHAERAIRIGPRNPGNWACYAYVAAAHMQEKRYKDAADAAKKAVQLNNYMTPAHLVLAASYAHLGRLNEAQAAVKQSLKLDPTLSVSRLLEVHPVAKYKNLDAFIDGLRKAGLPD